MSLCGVKGSELLEARAIKNYGYGAILWNLMVFKGLENSHDMLLWLSRQANCLGLVCNASSGLFCALRSHTMSFGNSSFLFFCLFWKTLDCIVLADGTIFVQVFDLSVVKPSDFVRYGLGCLERLADQGDNCAKDIRANLRIMVRA